MGLSHFDESGKIRMVDISEKDATKRRAVARGRVILSRATVQTIRDGANPKGDPFEIAAMVRTLCGPSGGYMTGQTIHINGGLSNSGV